MTPSQGQRGRSDVRSLSLAGWNAKPGRQWLISKSSLRHLMPNFWIQALSLLAWSNGSAFGFLVEACWVSSRTIEKLERTSNAKCQVRPKVSETLDSSLLMRVCAKWSDCGSHFERKFSPLPCFLVHLYCRNGGGIKVNQGGRRQKAGEMSFRLKLRVEIAVRLWWLWDTKRFHCELGKNGS